MASDEDVERSRFILITFCFLAITRNLQAKIRKSLSAHERINFKIALKVF